jgi:hypothetical protein
VRTQQARDPLPLVDPDPEHGRGLSRPPSRRFSRRRVSWRRVANPRRSVSAPGSLSRRAR